MAICPLCDDSGLLDAETTHPSFCYCAAGKRSRRQWEAEQGGNTDKPASFIDIGQLEQVNASVDAMRTSLLGPSTSEKAGPGRHAAVQLLQRVAHPGHEVTMTEAMQLHDLAKSLEGFLSDINLIGRKKS